MSYFSRILLDSSMRQGKLHCLDSTLKYLGVEDLYWCRSERDQTALCSACLTGDVRFVEFFLKKGVKVDGRINETERCIHVACELGYVEIVKCLLDHGAVVNAHEDCEESDESEESDDLTPLHVAALCGHKDVVGVLIERGANIKDGECGKTPLHMACIGGNHEVVKLLVGAGANVNCSTSKGRTPLHLAAELGFAWVISVLLEAGAQIDALTENRHSTDCKSRVSPLYLAVNNHQLEAAIVLLRSGAKTDIQESGSPLHAACFCGDHTLAGLLLEHGADVNLREENDGYTPLIVSYRQRHHEIVTLLLDAGADVNMSSHGYTVLHTAASCGDSKIIRVLLDAGAQTNVISKDEKQVYLKSRGHFRSKVSPLFLAVNNCHLETATILLEAGAKIDIPECNVGPLHAVCCNGDCTLAGLILKHGADANLTVDQYNPLHLAYDLMHHEIVTLLLDAGADVNMSFYGSTVLHTAASRGDSRMIQVLLDAGAQINAISKNEQYVYHTDYGDTRTMVSPLFLAVNNCRLETVAILLEAGAKLDILGSNVGPLHAACFRGNRTLVDLLLKHGADVNSKSKEGGRTPLQVACIMGHHEIVKALVDTGANVNEHDTLKGLATYAPIHYAADCGHSTVIRVEADALVNVLSEEEEQEFTGLGTSRVSPLHLSVCKQHCEAATVLLQFGAKIDIPECKFSPLHSACFNNDLTMVELLLEHGADVDMRTVGSGETPLQIVTSLQDYDNVVVERLLERGADVNLPDDTGCTPLINALNDENCLVVELMLEHGGVLPSVVDKAMLDYEYDHDECDHDDGCSLSFILKRHLIRMKAASMWSPSESWSFAGNGLLVATFFEYYQECCIKELSSMKTKRIGSTDVTYYDLLRRGACVCRNQNVVEALEQTGDFANDFPCYRRLLVTKYKRGLRRCKLLEECYPVFAHLMKIDLPIVAFDELFAYLGDKDLENLIILYKDVRRARGQQKEFMYCYSGVSTANRTKNRDSRATEDDGDAREDSAGPSSKIPRQS